MGLFYNIILVDVLYLAYEYAIMYLTEFQRLNIQIFNFSILQIMLWMDNLLLLLFS